MPYVDPDIQRQHERARYFWKYFADPKFREKESERKAAWYRKNKKRILARLLAARRRRVPDSTS